MTSREQYAILRPKLSEQQWRIFLATEAEKIGFGGISQVARESGSDRKTIRRGKAEMDQTFSGARVRKEGGGRKKITGKDPSLIPDLESILEPKGDPMSMIRWTTQSLSTLVEGLAKKNHNIKKSALADVLSRLGFSLKANKKNIEGVSHPDRDLQFQHIKKTCEDFESRASPIISVDCKKKELIGNFKNNGEQWCAKGKNTEVNVYDFKNLSDGKAVPYGVYDIIKNTGFINVGIDHDTACFAVESIRRWWNTIGEKLYPNKTELLITSDGGGSNGVRNRLWKKELQQFANESGLSITVTHLPPATSKWNKIEHRLFSYISINWRGKPLTSMETIIELLSNTTTKKGLKVTAIVDQNKYPTGVKISDDEMNKLNIIRNEFHGDWNYMIKPQ
ncbi:MAG TPA: ISAzo13 family transposase [Flavilitoribacter sp.]|nr:ISAzo13 family transposase [Flavilitoribacter sp.]